MTDISVTKTEFQVENRSWLLGPHGTEPGTTPSVTLDISGFTPATHHPNGFIPSGTVVAEGTDGWEPYDGGGEGTDHEAGVGILFSSVKVPDSGADPGGAILVHGFVDPDRLPFQSGAGSLGENGASVLSLIHFAS